MQTFVLFMLLNIERIQEAPFNVFAYILIIYKAVLLSASGCTASGTDEATFLINQCLISAVRTFFAFSFRSVLHIFLQRTFYTILPGIDVFAVQL